MKLTNYNGKWDWAVFWLHGTIGFAVGSLLWLLTWTWVFAWGNMQFEQLIITSSIVGIIFFIWAGFFGEKFWNYLKEHGPSF
jgi:hypothetical protein